MKLLFNPKTLIEMLKRDVKQAEAQVSLYDKEMSASRKKIESLVDRRNEIIEEMKTIEEEVNKELKEISDLQAEQLKIVAAIETYKGMKE